MPDIIRISRLAVPTRIGVPEEERASEQTLKISLEIETDMGTAASTDDVDQTIDYAAVCESVKAHAAQRSRKLIETLAEEIAVLVLAEFGAKSVMVTIEKFILPDTESVGLTVFRRQ